MAVPGSLSLAPGGEGRASPRVPHGMTRSFPCLAADIASLVALAACVGCSSDGNAGDGTRGQSQFAQEYCALVKPCCQPAGLPDTMQSCQALLGPIPAADATAEQECIDAYKALAAQADWCSTLGGSTQPAPCKTAFPNNPSDHHGTKNPGDPCNTDSDCAASSQGEVACSFSGSSGGACQLRRNGAEGQTCEATRDKNAIYFSSSDTTTEITVCDRANGLFCGNGKCAALGGTGGPCTSDLGCVTGDYCGSGVCKARVGAGESCADSSTACQDKEYCHSAAQRCVPQKAKGEACASSIECLTQYCDSTNKTCQEFNGGELGLLMLCQ
jgi:hypothetical protein